MYLLKTFDATNHQLHVTNLRAYVFCPWKVINLPTEKVATLQISNSLGDKFSQWDSQNEILITHDEKKNRDHAKCFLFWGNHVSLRIYLIEL